LYMVNNLSKSGSLMILLFFDFKYMHVILTSFRTIGQPTDVLYSLATLSG
jgi:hypothetical protein